jgi:hypothetical protein
MCGRIEFYRPEHIAVVGHRHRGHIQLAAPLKKPPKTDSPIQKRILTMQMKVCKFSPCHNLPQSFTSILY